MIKFYLNSAKLCISVHGGLLYLCAKLKQVAEFCLKKAKTELECI